MKKIPAWALIILAILLAATPMFLNAGKDAEQPFAGTDSSAENVVEETDPGYTAWFSAPVGELPPEVESGLFALQAALGAGLLGFVLGSYRERAKKEARMSLAAEPAVDAATTESRSALEPQLAASGSSAPHPDLLQPGVDQPGEPQLGINRAGVDQQLPRQTSPTDSPSDPRR